MTELAEVYRLWVLTLESWLLSAIQSLSHHPDSSLGTLLGSNIVRLPSLAGILISFYPWQRQGLFLIRKHLIGFILCFHSRLSRKVILWFRALERVSTFFHHGREETIQDEAVRFVPEGPLHSPELLVCPRRLGAPGILRFLFWYIYIFLDMWKKNLLLHCNSNMVLPLCIGFFFTIIIYWVLF